MVRFLLILLAYLQICEMEGSDIASTESSKSASKDFIKVVLTLFTHWKGSAESKQKTPLKAKPSHLQ